MGDENPWERFFDSHAPIYMQNVFTQATLQEVEFAIRELALKPGDAILDLGCGTGRHSIELARRGYRMTGVDLSAGMLAEAARQAQEAAVSVEWIKADATKFRPATQFDGAICLCEGAFSLVGQDDPLEHDLAILRVLHSALKPGRKLLLTAINGMRHLRAFGPEDVAAGRYDPLTGTEHSVMTIETPQGKQEIMVRERGYVPSELTLLCRVAGFEVLHLWGGTAGAWRCELPQLDEMELMVIARRPPEQGVS